MNLTFEDEWGTHVHEIKGAPYDHKAKVTCNACIIRLNYKMTLWLETLSKRHKLPANFWQGYKFSWQE